MPPILIFFIVAAATFVHDRRSRLRAIRDFREMTPQELRALYENGGSISIVTRLGVWLRPVLFGVSAAIFAAILF